MAKSEQRKRQRPPGRVSVHSVHSVHSLRLLAAQALHANRLDHLDVYDDAKIDLYPVCVCGGLTMVSGYWLWQRAPRSRESAVGRAEYQRS